MHEIDKTIAINKKQKYFYNHKRESLTTKIWSYLREKALKNISYDPLETSWPIKLLRLLYRPFQSDKDWEWPFTKKVFYTFRDNFHIIERRGILGRAKWYFIISLLPLPRKKKHRIGARMHAFDWDKSATSDRHLFRCMHVTMLMQKK